VEVWLLWGLEPVASRGEDRVKSVEIGRHGLQIARGNARGLLLPGVAVEHKLDAKGFLEQVCRKAGRPQGAWKDDETTLMTFEGYAIEGRMDPGLAEGPTVPVGGPEPGDVSRLADFCRQNLTALVYGATANSYMPGGFDGNLCGAAISVQLPGSADRIECSRVSLRAEMPLQSGLFELVRAAATGLQAQRVHLQAIENATLGLSVFWDPAMQGTAAEPTLEGLDPRHRAVIVMDRGRWALSYDPERSAEELLKEASETMRIPDPSVVPVGSLYVVSTEPRLAITNVPRPQAGPPVRPPAVAGRFYPGTPDEIDRMLDDLLPEKRKAKPWAAAMVPHAGWIYSGRLAADCFRAFTCMRNASQTSPMRRPMAP
jgi:hypothetical protein